MTQQIAKIIDRSQMNLLGDVIGTVALAVILIGGLNLPNML